MNKSIIFDNEEFFEIIEYNIIRDEYFASRSGLIYCKSLNRLLHASPDSDGYLQVNLHTYNGRKKMPVAKVILTTFDGLPPDDMVDPTVEHKDNNRKNNNIQNLIWLERYENSSQRKGKPIGVNNPNSKLTESEVKQICTMLQSENKTLKQIGAEFSVSKDTIRDIKNKRTWRHITANPLQNTNVW